MSKKNKTFTVNMVRTGYGFCTYTVEATSLREARKQALDKAGNYDYSEKDAEYSIEDICESEED